MNPKVDQYLIDGCMRCDLGGTPECKVNDWQEELHLLRGIILDCGLTEELKWGAPCYTYDGNNILMLSALRGAAVMGFFKGSLLNNSAGLLTKPGESSQAVRNIRITNASQLKDLESAIKKYIFEAIEVEKAGLKVAFKKNLEPMPEELIQILEEDPILKSSFEALTAGRQRGYIIYFSQPKQAKTRFARIEKWIPKILKGEGMHDKYKSKKK